MSSPNSSDEDSLRPGPLFQALLDTSREGLCIFDADTRRLLYANGAFATMMGAAGDPAKGGPAFDELLDVSDSGIRRRAARRVPPGKGTEARLKRAEGPPLAVLLSTRKLQVQGREYLLCSLRPAGSESGSDVSWQRIQEIVRTNARAGILREKLERLHELASRLFSLREESRIVDTAGAFLSDRRKFGYAEVYLFLIRDGVLVNAYSSPPSGAGGSIAPPVSRLTAPMRGPSCDVGKIEVVLAPGERETLAGSPAAQRAHRNIVVAIGNLLGLFVENVRLYQQLFQQSILDPLTGLFNRRHLEQKLKDEMRRAARYGRPLSVLMMDLNGFKKINDSMGHRQGDQMLREFGTLLRSCTRDVDLVCRYGGDEFVLVFPETGVEDARAKGMALSQAVADARFTRIQDGKRDLKITCSFGTAAFTPDLIDQPPDEFIRRADEDMYASRRRTAGLLP